MSPTVGCGPYNFVEWESGSFARFVRNDNYWGTPAKIDEIFIRFVPDEASQTQALKAGDADMGTFVSYSEVPGLQDAGLNIVIEPNGYNEFMFFMVNEEKGHPALLDVRVRRAIALAIDRDGINRDLFLGLTKTPTSFWDALPYYNNPPLQPYPFDPAGSQDVCWMKQVGLIAMRMEPAIRTVLSSRSRMPLPSGKFVRMSRRSCSKNWLMWASNST